MEYTPHRRAATFIWYAGLSLLLLILAVIFWSGRAAAEPRQEDLIRLQQQYDRQQQIQPQPLAQTTGDKPADDDWSKRAEAYYDPSRDDDTNGSTYRYDEDDPMARPEGPNGDVLHEGLSPEIRSGLSIENDDFVPYGDQALPMQDMVALCGDTVKSSDRQDCMRDAITERNKVHNQY